MGWIDPANTGAPTGSASVSASPVSRFLTTAATLLAIACSETPAIPTQLAFTVQPAPETAGIPIFPTVAVAIQDAAGNTVTAAPSDITVAIGTNPANGTLAGSLTRSTVNGVATFYNLSINYAGAGYTLSASSPNLSSATSIPFAVGAGPAADLTFRIQPVNTSAFSSIPTFAVAVTDASGNTIVTATNSIKLALGTNPWSGTLSGTTTVAAVNGVATFSNLSVNNVGPGYTLSASSPTLNSVTSVPFAVLTGPAAKLVFALQPVATSPGASIPTVSVAVTDAAGNISLSASNSITLAIGANAGSGTLSGTTTVAAVGGVATFSDLRINNAGAGYTLTASATNLSGGTSNAFNIRNPLLFMTVTAGYFHSCAVGSGGAAHCWGDNTGGQLGNIAEGGGQSRSPLAVAGGLTFTKVAAGRSHNCGVNLSGIAYCWGDNSLGDGTTNAGFTPVPVAGGLTFASVSAGYSHTCGVTTGGAGYCWGDNSSGQLGNATQVQLNTPGAVSGGLTFASVSPGRFFTCGVTSAHAAFCWGNNASGQLGDGTRVQRTTPVPVSGQLNFSWIGAGGFHSCGLTTGGAAYCWGDNFSGQLGNGAALSSFSNDPVPVSGALVFTALSVGNRHACALTAAGVAYCWGGNDDGQLGDGTKFSRNVPIAVVGGLTFASVSAGRFHSCGVTVAGSAYCWGGNSTGALGNGTTIGSLLPVPVR